MEIRPEVMTSLRKQALAGSLRRIAASLRASLPAETSGLSDDQLHGLIDRGILQADRYGIGSEWNSYVFIAAQILFESDFKLCGDPAGLNEIVTDARIAEDIKASVIQTRVRIDKSREL